MINKKNMLKLGLILAAFAAAACIMLAFVHTGTSKIIEKRAYDDQQAALKEIFTDADSFREVSGVQKSTDTAVKIVNTFEAVVGKAADSSVVGLALELSCTGYSGAIRLLVGVNTGGVITGVKILEHSDTPGLGANAASPTYFVDRAKGLTFYGQFAGKRTGDPFEVKNDVTAITASTITSRAVTRAVKAAGIAASAYMKKGAAE
jgi:electron transport complex protein RnfG